MNKILDKFIADGVVTEMKRKKISFEMKPIKGEILAFIIGIMTGSVLLLLVNEYYRFIGKILLVCN